MVDIRNFIKKNHNKKLTVKVWFLAAKYRFLVKFFSKKHLEKKWGTPDEESPEEITREELRFAHEVATYVNRSCGNTPWESKCLVRALTARELLMEKGISNTLYLGVGKVDGKMVAHAWIRAGQCYVTGGNGKDYATVARFRS